jgi:hypothetical protein
MGQGASIIQKLAGAAFIAAFLAVLLLSIGAP